MGQIFQNEFATIIYFPHKKMMIAKWRQDSDKFLSDKYQKESTRIEHLTKEYDVNNLLIDIQDCSAILNGFNDEQFKDSIHSYFQDTQANKIAILVSRQLLINASFDAAKESLSNGVNNFSVQYFRDEQKAFMWMG